MTNKKALLLVTLGVIALLVVYAALNNEKNGIQNTHTTETLAKTVDALASVETSNYLLYLPQGFDNSTTHSLVVALSPTADAGSMIRTWKNIADRHQWIVYASKKSQNGIPIGPIMKSTVSDLNELENEYSVNKSRIIFTGFSGGAMGSHAFSFYYPKIVWAVVANTGMIDELYYTNKTYLFFYPKNKIAVFLASPTDFRYEQMKKDKIFLDSLGWKTKWIEFTGGHIIAPEEAYEEAADWLDEIPPEGIDTTTTIETPVKTVETSTTVETPVKAVDTSTTTETDDYLIYLPQGFDNKTSHPLVVALSPSADAGSMIRTWRNVADKHQWIVYASKKFQNGVSFDNLTKIILSDLNKVEKDYPVNTSRIIFAGFSGGGMGSHAFSYYYPKTVWAIVVNTGMMGGSAYRNATRSVYPKNKIAVFLASPTDFRYDEMKQDKIFLDSLGWETKWIEFTGGHTFAPEEAYEEAADWLEEIKT